MTWALVDSDGNITEHAELPENWQNISNFFALQDDHNYLAAMGWYLIEDTSSPITDDFTQYYGEPTYTVLQSKHLVEKNKPVLTKIPITPVDNFSQQRHQFLQGLREQRDTLLKNSDWTQLWDLQRVKGEDWLTQWMVYRQALRDLPGVYMQPPFDTTIDTSEIVWPQEPRV